MNTFNDAPLIEPLQRALRDENYETPTPIQGQTIPAALDGRDILGCAQTGTGKTAAFALPVLHQLGQKTRKAIPNRPLALILAPTRELAIQIGESCATYGRHLHLRQTLVYGGVNQTKQVRAMKRGVHVLIATPGRLIDLMNQGHITLDRLQMFVLDEADRMLDMGFLPDLKRIIRELPEERQSLFFSATLSPNITELAEDLLSDPVTVNVTPDSISLKAITQEVKFLERSQKVSALRNILQGEDVQRTIVFVKTKRGVDQLVDQLDQYGIGAESIHGNKSQRARQRALNAFRDHRVRVLVATDVAARGIDVDGVSHVVNFDLPMEPENYIHRIGRTGRAGANGIAISFCNSIDRKLLVAIERLIEERIPVDPDHPAPAGSGPRYSKNGSSKSYRPSKNGSGKRPSRRKRPRKPEGSSQDTAPASKRPPKPGRGKAKAAAERRIAEKAAKRVHKSRNLSSSS